MKVRVGIYRDPETKEIEALRIYRETAMLDPTWLKRMALLVPTAVQSVERFDHTWIATYEFAMALGFRALESRPAPQPEAEIFSWVSEK